MPLSEDDIANFKSKLLDMKAKLSHTLEGNTQEVKKPNEATGYSQHQADQGTDTFDRTISLEVTTKEYEVLKQINRALQKIEECSYGICDVSGEEIPLARLKAIPYATMTVKAQEQFEKGLLSGN
ncbi:prokaryotic dksA/traR C4-type zinc finger family protein [Chlamydia ibidis]|uniref:Prokaryotic dksA/traR C4-type zinc finger family protein n=2 Tax=Chlamydia ibidis TaxID=1405396 RepID=S7J5S6_9CHLA|nr:TraR/DksA family transcriptional regulator [Chlamydia ibidis]EPP35452.1 prokaryotic dksA/traR C4-type zinc finger family protein [Chlamydia ibidis]EQM63035.1 prokaryotic dksA/traR C4-type zinc finger family protein [Chlamydia ibidis 10-1398/6]